MSIYWEQKTSRQQYPEVHDFDQSLLQWSLSLQHKKNPKNHKTLGARKTNDTFINPTLKIQVYANSHAFQSASLGCNKMRNNTCFKEKSWEYLLLQGEAHLTGMRYIAQRETQKGDSDVDTNNQTSGFHGAKIRCQDYTLCSHDVTYSSCLLKRHNRQPFVVAHACLWLVHTHTTAELRENEHLHSLCSKPCLY